MYSEKSYNKFNYLIYIVSILVILYINMLFLFSLLFSLILIACSKHMFNINIWNPKIYNKLSV
jgi:hypothetical protein